MAGRGFVGVVLAACLVGSLMESSLAATSHTVGGSTGWTIPSTSSLYSSWASKQSFKVGDSLVFNFQSGSHTVAEVSKSDYDACTATNPISSDANGPSTLALTTAGTHYYICTISGHCTAGQKLAITATTGSSLASPSPASSAPAPSSGGSSSTPSPSEATSPTTSTIPSAQSPAGGATAPAPSSATVAGAGLALPYVMIASAFLGLI